MSEWVIDLTTDEDIDAALEEASHLPPMPAAISAVYNSSADTVIIAVDDGRELVIPRKHMQGLRDATPEQISEIQIFPPNDICWPQLDLDHNLYSLLEGRYGNQKWQANLQNAQAAA